MTPSTLLSALGGAFRILSPAAEPSVSPVRRRTMLLVVLHSCILSGCTGTLLPSFDGGSLNPDIRYLRAGEVMTGVKCAVVAFLKEREKFLMDDRVGKWSDYQELERSKDLVPQVSAINARDFKYQKPCKGGDKLKPLTTDFCEHKRRDCPLGTHEELVRDISVKPPKEVYTCVANTQCNPLSQKFWDYTNSKKRPDTPPKVGETDGKCAPVPDYSNFALDPNQHAQITFMLKAINGGFINYAKIDATRLPGWLQNYVAPGSAQSPFPQLSANAASTTLVEFSTVIAQSLHTPLPKQPIVFRNRPTIDQVDRAKPRLAPALPPSTVQSLSSKSAPLDQTMSTLETLAARSKHLPPRADPLASDLGDKSAALFSKLKSAPSGLPGGAPKDYPAFLVAPKEYEAFLGALTKFSDTARARLALAELSKTIDEIDALFKQPATPTTETSLKTLAQKLQSQIATLKALQATVPVELAVTIRNAVEAASQIQFTASSPQPEPVKARWPYRDEAAEKEDFQRMCNSGGDMAQLDDTTRIDYLAIKHMLHNIVEEQNRKDTLYQGGVPLTLDNVKLTSSFQVILEMQAGTLRLFRIVPLIAPPNTEFKADHTHSLSITLRGKKQKGDQGAPVKLAESCRERVSPEANQPFSIKRNGREQRITPCETVPALLLEQVIQELQAGGAKASTP